MRPFFRELVTSDFAGQHILLDLDGTLLCDGERKLLSPEEHALRKLSAVAGTVVIVSNNPRGRESELASAYNVTVLQSRFRKPSPRVLDDLPDKKSDWVVIGDKVLTDGWFARNIGAAFVHVRPLTNKEDSLFVSVSYTVDAVAAFLLRAVPFLVLMRFRQWAKNALLFIPIVFAGRLFVFDSLLRTVEAFFAFSLVASAGYVVNDIRDRTSDALHPLKRKRPIASGRVSPRDGARFSFLLYALSLSAGLFVPAILPWLFMYAGLSFLYSFLLKRIPIIEMLCIGVFFLLRVEAGGAAAQFPVSGWLILITITAALFVASCKRYAESLHTAEKQRTVLRMYPRGLLRVLPAVLAIILSVSYISYSLFGAPFEHAFYSSIFVTAGVFWYLRSMYQGETEEPDVRLWRDPVLFGIIVLWAVSIFVPFYADTAHVVFSSTWQRI
jgi:decaprenyl-phosphate phosphoribosyltransferase